jgi:hypothetical protein
MRLLGEAIGYVHLALRPLPEDYLENLHKVFFAAGTTKSVYALIALFLLG